MPCLHDLPSSRHCRSSVPPQHYSPTEARGLRTPRAPSGLPGYPKDKGCWGGLCLCPHHHLCRAIRRWSRRHRMLFKQRESSRCGSGPPGPAPLREVGHGALRSPLAPRPGARMAKTQGHPPGRSCTKADSRARTTCR